MWPIIQIHALKSDGRTWITTSGIVDQEPNECPYCYKIITPRFIDSYAYPSLYVSQSTLQSIYQCSNNDCGLFFIASYKIKKHNNGENYYLTSIGQIPDFLSRLQGNYLGSILQNHILHSICTQKSNSLYIYTSHSNPSV
jgi:hypothetical protein